MTSAEHIAQAELILAGLRKLTLPDDYLAIVDSGMVIGYHLGNALLHRHGVAPDANHTNTPSKLDCAISALPAPIRPAFDAFAALEKLRFDFVRSPSVYDERLATEVWRHIETMRQSCRG
jgi:hypothetical protein